MNTKRTTALAFALAIMTGAFSTPLLANPGRGIGHAYGHDRFNDHAKVIASTPIFEEYNEPRQECWTERVGDRYESRDDRSYAGAIIGGIAGGILGNQVGKGTGKTVATAIGAATGAMVGDSIDNNGERHDVRRSPRYEERCHTVDNWSRRITGYNVTYRYHGRDYTTVLPYNPGSTVRVKVHVALDD